MSHTQLSAPSIWLLMAIRTNDLAELHSHSFPIYQMRIRSIWSRLMASLVRS